VQIFFKAFIKSLLVNNKICGILHRGGSVKWLYKKAETFFLDMSVAVCYIITN